MFIVVENRMNKSLIFMSIFFVALIAAGFGVSQSNTYRALKEDQAILDSLNLVDTSLAVMDTTVFKLQEYNEEAITRWQQKMAMSQMSPEQRAEYQRQYEMYMLQMEQQKQMIAQQKEYERRVREGGGVPPVSDKTQSRIEKLKKEFEEKRRRD